ncbi:NAD(P)/FAD-dependent oxidoreductase [Flavobacterium sp. FlaQc-50]|uniref:NAD(P)/FAD-dependent oxidoreductase n=1 Tax=unclassified Flavobacterium TaxID=196869 RepID=UPI0037569D64
MNTKREHAVVIGGSMAGLVTARVLSKHFRNVTIIEKDKVNDKPETRKGQPQTRHIHLVLAQAMNILLGYFPSLKKELIEAGALELDVCNDYNWYSYGGYKKKGVTGITALTMTRELLEYHVKKHVLSIGNITILDETKALEMKMKDENVYALVLEKAGEKQLINTDFVVDASGRGTRAYKWLEQHGYATPEETKIKIDIMYVTILLERKEIPQGKKAEVISYTPDAPNEKLGAVLMPIEENRWVLTLIGMRGVEPPQNDEELLKFLKGLPISGLYDTVSEAKRLTDFLVFKCPHSIRRHYEKLKKFPGSYVVLGDAVSNFNPMYAQGMASSICQAKVLDEVLTIIPANDKVFKPHIKKVNDVIEDFWTAGSYEDFKYPETEGEKPVGLKMVNGYMKALQKAANKDTELFKEILEVAGYLKSGKTLFRPKIMWKVFKTNL